ncbi:hypothetical protein M409DRAFT_53404 [Zasmidium cellare ATCC 36951]|uniref:SWIRM domain-containing protein n=1 Tax=Zasmidium cellare ATCC 36951 TaxID=1080233 RepID=A0A6A6CN67_ZASCE|nr:uncharacterized protein M409DRAFT_53404 [Zasmidium cellare ATCC 36951]KAF2168083.1 hypothetical protein M409DRAFT_53404 [Zasmidium cellare ATCC 36951]
MASQPQQQEQKKAMSMAMAAVPQLLTPDQPMADSFVVSGPEPRMPSPPASPEFNAELSFQHKDDVLYPDHNITDSTHDQKPLFDTSHNWTTPEREQRSPTATSLSITTPRSSVSSPDQHHDLQSQTLLPKIQSQKSSSPVGPVEHFNTYGMEYWKFMMSQNEAFRERQRAARQLPQPSRRANATPRDPFTVDMVSSLGGIRISKPSRANAVAKVKTPKAVPAKPAARSQATVATSRVDSPPKRSRRKTATPDPSLGILPHAAQPKPRTRAAPTKKIDDKSNAEWAQLPDYCPPTSSLDSMSKKMTASWTNGNPLNLDTDPDRGHLHPQELVVASVLRLHCNSYLANKRRIFAARYQALLDGKDFNKTSAQVSAKIDVNKSSKLWESFDSVGWFDKTWFEKYL